MLESPLLKFGVKLFLASVEEKYFILFLAIIDKRSRLENLKNYEIYHNALYLVLFGENVSSAQRYIIYQGISYK